MQARIARNSQQSWRRHSRAAPQEQDAIVLSSTSPAQQQRLPCASPPPSSQELHKNQSEWYPYAACVHGNGGGAIEAAASGTCAEERGWRTQELVECATGKRPALTCFFFKGRILEQKRDQFNSRLWS